MIREIIELLKVDDFSNSSELIDIAKGKHKLPETFKELKQKIRRR